MALFLSFSGCKKSETAAPASPGAAPGKPDAALRAFAGAHARVVWCRDQDNNCDPFAYSNRFKLFGLDTDDGRGEREILSQSGRYTKPLLTPRGDRIVFTDLAETNAWVVNWDGSGLRRLTNGCAIEVWRDPKEGIEWLFWQQGTNWGHRFERNPVFRARLDDLSQAELFWDKTPVDGMSSGNFQLSADGTKAGGLFPWPDCGLIDLTTKTWKNFGDGCWTSMAPDNSYRFWKFDGRHMNIRFYAPGTLFGVKIPMNTAPGAAGREMYHPRWSNHERLFVITGPYAAGKGDNQIGEGGEGVEVLVGQFDQKFSKIGAWLQLTHDQRADAFPDLWVAPEGSSPMPGTPVTPVVDNGAPGEAWPGTAAGLVFAWADRGQPNTVTDPGANVPRACRLEPRGWSHYGRYNVMAISGQGAFVAQGGEAEWLAQAQQSREFSLEALVTPDSNATNGALISFGPEGGPANVKLSHEAGKLVITAAPKGRTELAALPAGKAAHLLVTLANGQLTAFVNGVKVSGPVAHAVDFAAWKPGQILLGENWSGAMEAVAIYSRALTAEQASVKARLAAARLKERKPAEQLVVEVRLKEVTPTPTLEWLGTYRRCLAVYGYEVVRVLAGKYDQKKLLVAHWVILDTKTVPNRPPALNGTYRLALEPFDEHPQLDSERIAQTGSDFELPLYYDPKP